MNLTKEEFKILERYDEFSLYKFLFKPTAERTLINKLIEMDFLEHDKIDWIKISKKGKRYLNLKNILDSI